MREFFERTGVENLTLYIDGSARASAKLGVIGLPATLLIDEEGRELGRLIGPAEWDSPEMVGFIRGFIAGPGEEAGSAGPEHAAD